MAILFQLIILGLLTLIGFQVYNAVCGNGSRPIARGDGKTIDGVAEEVTSPGRNAAETLKRFENARADLKQRYPAVFSMFGGYLNARTIGESGSLEVAVKEMIADWTARGDEVMRELTKLLAENETEEECRAVVLAACDAELEEEGYRAWLTWLLGQFNAFG